MAGFGGDPTPLGWTITLAYALVAWRCAALARGAVDRGARRFWLMLAIGLACLCVNKQLDLQAAVTAYARETAKAAGWYADRRPVQIAALAAAAVLALGALALAGWSMRGRLACVWPAIAGMAVILAYIALRMSSIHEVDAFVVGGPLPMKWWGELAGLALVAWGAQRALGAQRARDAMQEPPEDARG